MTEGRTSEAAVAGAGTLESTYERIGAGLYRLALAITLDPASAEDAVHEAFARTLARWEELGDRERLDAYLYRATRNLAYKQAQRAQRERPHEDLRLVEANPDRPGDVQEAATVSRALARLPVSQREVVMLRVYDGLSFVAIARRLGVAEGTVHSRFRLALQKLRVALGDTP